MFAAHNKLDNLVAVVDNNGLQIDGKIYDICSPAPIDEKFEAFGWRVIKADGHDFDSLERAFDEAETVQYQPVVIIQSSVKGKGVSFMENNANWHGVAPNEAEFALAMNELTVE
jgi:transketolase